MIWRVLLLVLISAAPVFALDPGVSRAVITRSATSPADSVRLPRAPWTPDSPVAEVEGAIRRTAYAVADPARTTLQLIAPLRDALEQDGYETVFSCADAACGGFDFRFQLDLLPEPDMHVDLGNYRYVLLERPGAQPHTVSIVSSASATTGFLHVTEVSDVSLTVTSPVGEPTAEIPDAAPPPVGFAAALETSGRVVLSDLEFNVGSAELGAGPFGTLDALAGWLQQNPTARVVLVGHTDAVGSLAANTSLSQRRASAVVDRLVGAFDVDPAQLQSAGAGFLAPMSTNLTPEGRAENRRVEVVLLTLG